MADADSCVTIHIATSLDGFIARKDGSVDWLEASDGISLFEGLDRNVAPHLSEVNAYRTGMVGLRYEARK